ncbi:MAG: rhodanese-like domain-containing protein [Candidatus Competibacterales bacterium]
MTTTIVDLSPTDAAERFERNEVSIIDVREPVEYAFERIKGALLMPMSTFDSQKLPRATDRVWVFHCGSGKRSRRVCELCQAAGWDDVSHIDGGIAAWKAAGLPVVTINPANGSLRVPQ